MYSVSLSRLARWMKTHFFSPPLFTAHRIGAVRHRVQVKSARLQRLGCRGLDGDDAHQLRLTVVGLGFLNGIDGGQSMVTYSPNSHFTQAQFSTPRFEGNINIIAFMNTHVIKCQYGMFTFFIYLHWSDLYLRCIGNLFTQSPWDLNLYQ